MWLRLLHIVCGIILVLGGESAFLYFVTRNDMTGTDIFIAATMSFAVAVWGATLILNNSKEDSKA